jgi:predicted nucleic acid-binding protein
MPVVSNSSPLIALEQIKQLDLLQALFGQIFIPGAVADEISATVQPRKWIRQHTLLQPLLAQTQIASLCAGEREAICLAVEINTSAIILDDASARNTAITLRLRVLGTAGVLLLAKERRLIESVKPCLDSLIDHRFFLSRQVYELILNRAGESTDKLE